MFLPAAVQSSGAATTIYTRSNSSQDLDSGIVQRARTVLYVRPIPLYLYGRVFLFIIYG
jgi:hypothetical protein